MHPVVLCVGVSMYNYEYYGLKYDNGVGESITSNTIKYALHMILIAPYTRYRDG